MCPRWPGGAGRPTSTGLRGGKREKKLKQSREARRRVCRDPGSWGQNSVWAVGAPEDKAVRVGSLLFIPERGEAQDGPGLMARLDQHAQLCCLRKEATATLPAYYTVVLI